MEAEKRNIAGPLSYCLKEAYAKTQIMDVSKKKGLQSSPFCQWLA